MKKVILVVLATVVFGKLTPLLLVALLIIGLVVIIKESVKEGKQW